MYRQFLQSVPHNLIFTKMRSSILFLLLISSFSSFSQGIFQDAKKLAKFTSTNVIMGVVADSINVKKTNFNRANLIINTSTFSEDQKTKAKEDTLKIGESLRFSFRQRDTLLSILIKYKVISKDDISDLRSTDSLNKRLNRNPFLEPFEDIGALQSNVANAANKLNLSSVLSSVKGVDVTNVANGVASFMIDRAKEELNVAFFYRFQKFIKDHPEFQALFPKTSDNISNLVATKYPEMLSTLRTGFVEDLEKLIYHFDDVLQLPKYRTLLAEFPEIKLTLKIISSFHELESGYSHPAELLTRISKIPEWKDPKADAVLRNIGNTLKLANIFSESLRNDPQTSGDKDRAWVTSKEVKELVLDEVAFKIYLGLIYQTVKNENIEWDFKGQKIRFDALMEAEKNNLLLFENQLVEFVALSTKVDAVKKEIEKKRGLDETISNDDYFRYISTSLDVIEYSFGVAALFDRRIDAGPYMSVARKSNDLYKHIYRKEYPQAVVNAMDIIKDISEMIKAKQDIENSEAISSDKILKGLRKAVQETRKATGDNTEAIKHQEKEIQDKEKAIEENEKAIKQKKKAIERLNSFIERGAKYMIFIANVAVAKSEDDVVKALENAVLPVGSSSIKKNSVFNISVQSYLGAYARTDNPDKNKNNSWNDGFGVHAPIGVSFNFGLNRWGSVGLFGSIFDIGAIVDYKLVKDESTSTTGTTGTAEPVKKEYKIELGQIVSPGLYFVYGMAWNVPLSLGFGCQYGPGLGKIDADNTVQVRNPSWRVNAFLSVDIPFFTLLNRPKRHKIGE